MNTIIRDNTPLGNIATQALIMEWHLSRYCQVQGCSNDANTIIRGEYTYTLCEEHFQQGNQPGGCKLTLRLGAEAALGEWIQPDEEVETE